MLNKDFVYNGYLKDFTKKRIIDAYLDYYDRLNKFAKQMKFIKIVDEFRA